MDDKDPLKFYRSPNYRQIVEKLYSSDRNYLREQLQKDENDFTGFVLESQLLDPSELVNRVFHFSYCVFRRFGFVINLDTHEITKHDAIETVIADLSAPASLREKTVAFVGLAIQNLIYLSAYRLAIAMYNRLRAYIAQWVGEEGKGLNGMGTILKKFHFNILDLFGGIYLPKEKKYFDEAPLFARCVWSERFEFKHNGINITVCKHGIMRGKFNDALRCGMHRFAELKKYACD
jgi:hypothetical protein